MKKLLSLLLVGLMLVPLGTAAFATDCGAADVFKAESFSNTAFADASVEDSEGAVITGKVNVPFTFNNDGAVVLIQNSVEVMRENIASDGTYQLTGVPAGLYDVLISIPGWTDYNVYDIAVAGGKTYDIYENTVIAGDVNKDNIINVGDIGALIISFGKSADEDNNASDVNHDGVIDIADISQILAEGNYGEKAYSSFYDNNGYTLPY